MKSQIIFTINSIVIPYTICKDEITFGFQLKLNFNHVSKKKLHKMRNFFFSPKFHINLIHLLIPF